MTLGISTNASIHTISCKMVNLADPLPETICLKDIAMALSRQSRFNGHLDVDYTVGQHSLFVYEWVCQFTTDPETQLWALLHDAHEAYVGDISSPMKLLLRERAPGVLDKILRDLDLAISSHFGIDIDEVDHTAVKKADLLAIAYEAINFMPTQGEPWLTPYCGTETIWLAKKLSVSTVKTSEDVYTEYTEVLEDAMNKYRESS